MTSSLISSTSPMTAILANWAPKCNSEMEKRIRLDFEVPLTEEMIENAAPTIRHAARAVGNPEGGMPDGKISTELDQTIELYSTPDHTTPIITLSNVKLVSLACFRPMPKDGPSSGVFLTFSATAKAEAPFGGQLATWALENLRSTIFFRGFDVQGTLPLVDSPEPAPKKTRVARSGKDAAAGAE
jgi:hypothetical protein